MIRPLTPGQKVIAYFSLFVILVWMVLGILAIWIILT